MKKQTKRPRRTTIIDEIEQKKAQFELERDDYFKKLPDELENLYGEGIDIEIKEPDNKFVKEKEKVFNIINNSDTSIDEWIIYLNKVIDDLNKIK